MTTPATSSRWDAIVVGSGFGGLTSALILARHGWKVLVLERHYRPGGFLHRFHHKGMWYDTGFHYTGALDDGQVLDQVLKYIGIRDRVSPHPLDRDGFDHLHFPDGFCFKVPCGHERFAEALADRFPDEADACRRYVRDMRDMVSKFPLYNLSREEITGTADLLLGPTLAEYLEELTQNRRLRAVLSIQSVLYGVRPADVPLAVHMLVVDSFIQSAWGIDGGGDALAQAAVDRLQELGGEVRTSAEVTAIEVQNGHATGVVIHGEERIAAPVVIANCHPKVMLDLVPEGSFRPVYGNRIRELKDGIGTVGLYVKTSADLSSFGAHNVYRVVSDDVDAAYDQYTAGPGRAPGIYYTVPSARDRLHTGEHVIVALAFQWYADAARWQSTRPFKRGREYDDFKLESAAGMMAVLEKELPQIRDQILTVEASTPLTNEHYAASPGGAAYGIYHDRHQAMFAVQPRTKVKGLLLTGHSVMLPGITGVGLTAFYTCAYLLGFQELRQGLIDA